MIIGSRAIIRHSFPSGSLSIFPCLGSPLVAERAPRLNPQEEGPAWVQGAAAAALEGPAVLPGISPGLRPHRESFSP